MQIAINRQILGTLLALTLLGTAALPSRADTVATTFGPSQSYVANSWWNVGSSSSSPAPQVDAFSFTPSQTVTLTSADLALLQLSSSATPLNVYIESNLAGTPGTILDTLTQIGSYAGGPAQVVNFTCSVCSVLQSGTTYWIVGQQSDPTQVAGWLYSPNTTGTWYFDETNSATGPWTAATAGNTFSAFDINGTPGVAPTPEPASLWLMGSGLIGIAAAARRRWNPVR